MKAIYIYNQHNAVERETLDAVRTFITPRVEAYQVLTVDEAKEHYLISYTPALVFIREDFQGDFLLEEIDNNFNMIDALITEQYDAEQGYLAAPEEGPYAKKLIYEKSDEQSIATLATMFPTDPAEGSEWIENIYVDINWEREYDSTMYKCVQSHITQLGWEPHLVPALWTIVQIGTEWQEGVAYATNDEVTYETITYGCITGHTSQIGWEPPNVPALWSTI